MSKIVQKHHGTRFSNCSCHCEQLRLFVCLREQQSPGGAWLTDRSTGIESKAVEDIGTVCRLLGLRCIQHTVRDLRVFVVIVEIIYITL